MENKLLELIKTRRSCRRYRPVQIEDRELAAVLEAGTFAPTSMGRQDPWIVAVQRPDLLDRLARMNAEIMGSKGNPYYDAPTVVLVFAPADSRNAVQDASCVLENMMLAAHALGLGSCWINREIEMFRTSEGHDLMVRELGLPEGLTGVGAISLGYPDGAASPCKPRKEGYVRISDRRSLRFVRGRRMGRTPGGRRGVLRPRWLNGRLIFSGPGSGVAVVSCLFWSSLS